MTDKTLDELLRELDDLRKNAAQPKKAKRRIPKGWLVLALILAIAGLALGAVLLTVTKSQTVNAAVLSFSPDPATTTATLGQPFAYSVTGSGLVTGAIYHLTIAAVPTTGCPTGGVATLTDTTSTGGATANVCLATLATVSVTAVAGSATWQLSMTYTAATGAYSVNYNLNSP